MSWVKDLLDVVTSASWMAGLLQTVLGTGAALLVAYFLFLRQIRHDAALIERQLAADDNARRASRRAAAAEELGRSLINLRALRHDVDTNLGYELMSDRSEPPRQSQLETAWHSAGVAIVDLDSEIWRGDTGSTAGVGGSPAPWSRQLAYG